VSQLEHAAQGELSAGDDDPLDNWLAAVAAAWTSSVTAGAGSTATRGRAAAGPKAGLPEGDQVRRRVRTRAALHQRGSGDRAQAGRRGRRCRSQRAQLPGRQRAESLIERGASTAAVATAGRWKDPVMVVRYAKAQEAGKEAVESIRVGQGCRWRGRTSRVDGWLAVVVFPRVRFVLSWEQGSGPWARLNS